ncbi:PREDICTED: uncharacterized protein LOC105562089 isoform X1 [Vollenhovia emeryi]|uniref:uncharacterized protein LOC105562089 isoform X1 n=1 Tax=Vollenhovia emeryi TaxID=411798 RepID=UPI0005F58D33|nr:PREDICTED: uncharacterized protein LOC105562089 isoform X1 [Vollenhovia emeryi]
MKISQLLHSLALPIYAHRPLFVSNTARYILSLRAYTNERKRYTERPRKVRCSRWKNTSDAFESIGGLETVGNFGQESYSRLNGSSSPLCNRNFLGLTTLVTFEPPVPADEYGALLEDLVTCYGCLEGYVCVCESVRFRQSRSSLGHERLFQSRQPRQERRCLVVDYKRIHYPLYKINHHDERERKRESNLVTNVLSVNQSVAADDIHN